MSSPSAADTLTMCRKELDAKLELLQRMCLQELGDAQAPDGLPSPKMSFVDVDTGNWIDAEYKWALDEARDSAISLPSVLNEEEEAIDACMPHAYDPTLFSLPPTRPSPPVSKHQRGYSDKDKPLPDIPRSPSPHREASTSWPNSPCTPPPSPHSPERSFVSTFPRTSPRSSKAYAPPISTRSASLPSRIGLSADVVREALLNPTSIQPPRSAPHRHTNYPSISSTLGLLEERETETEKRAAVYVTGAMAVDEPAASARRGSNASEARSSAEVPRPKLGLGKLSPKRKQRPTLPALSTSISSPQLRTLALQSASSPSRASPASSTSPSPSAASPKSVDSSTPSTVTPTPRTDAMDDDAGGQQLASRWSVDSVAARPPRASFLPLNISIPSSPTTVSPPVKGGTRERLIGFISRARAGSLGKTIPPVIPAAQDPSITRSSLSKEPHFVIMSPRPSLSTPLSSPLLNSHFSITPSPSSSHASSATSLPTPTDSTFDPFSPNAESCIFPDDVRASYDAQSLRVPETPISPSLPPSPPPEPTLPLPSPNRPSPSFLVPPRPQTFFSALALKRRLRPRAKKLVISGIEAPDAPPSAQDDARRIEERRRRLANVVQWCESFGALRKVERKDDGTLHVYWRQWEVADMVCRVQAQVYIKEVGRVNLAWHYIS